MIHVFLNNDIAILIVGGLYSSVLIIQGGAIGYSPVPKPVIQEKEASLV